MLKKRIAAVVIVKDGTCVQSIGFEKFLPIGKPEIVVDYLNQWGIDEIIYLDISATKNGVGPNFATVRKISKKCFVPLTVGGGIKSVSDIQKLIKFGADKVVINSALLKDPLIVKRASDIFGNQCIVISIDVQKINGEHNIISYAGIPITQKDPIKYAKALAELGAGEVFLNNIKNDGMREGYDLNLLKLFVRKLEIPVIACGGAGKPIDFLKVFTVAGVACAAAGNYFHFTEHSVLTTKSYLKKRGVDLRSDFKADYKGFNFDINGRLKKKSDRYLAKQRFIYYPPETI